MGKKRIVKKSGEGFNAELKQRALSRASKKKISHGVLYIEATYNNTKLTLTDTEGRVASWSSSGALGFGGAKKATPFAAAKIGEVIGEKAIIMGMKEADIVVRGVGSGRESAIRSFSSKGINILSIRDMTPVPHNGPKPKKPRRV